MKMYDLVNETKLNEKFMELLSNYDLVTQYQTVTRAQSVELNIAITAVIHIFNISCERGAHGLNNKTYILGTNDSQPL